MSRVTSLRARSSFSWDSARTDFLTMSCAWSEFVPTTSMEPQTLSISRDLCWTPAIENDFWMFSSSCTGMSLSDSSRVIRDTDGDEGPREEVRLLLLPAAGLLWPRTGQTRKREADSWPSRLRKSAYLAWFPPQFSLLFAHSTRCRTVGFRFATC